MKKISYFLISFLLIFNVAIAQQNLENKVNQALNNTQMPSDSEIMQMINKFNVPQEQKEMLFIQTKQQLEQMYTSKNADAFIQSQFGSYENAQNMLPEIEKMMQGNNSAVQVNERVKKYSNHPPLTR